MLDNIYEFLKEEKSGLKASEIAHRFLKMVHISESLSQRVVSAILKEDGRFILSPDFRWRAKEGSSLLDRKIFSLSFVVVDVETTGQAPPEHRVTEIGAVKIEDGTVSGTFSSLVYPGRAIPTEITALTGISEEMVRHSPPWAFISPYFRHFLGQSIFVGHNASFDLGFINSEMKLGGDDLLNNEKLCTVKLARRLHKELPDHKLDTVAGHFEVSLEGRHRALGDALITAKVFLAFLARFKEMGLITLREVKELEKGS